jgi:hypothetical protein
VSKWKSDARGDAWNDRVKVRGEDMSMRRFDEEGIVVENVKNLEVNGTERLAGLNAPERREWARWVLMVMDEYTCVGKRAFARARPELA